MAALPTVWRCGRGRGSTPAPVRPPPAVREVFRTQERIPPFNAARPFPNPRVPLQTKSGSHRLHALNAGAAVGFKCAGRKRFSDSIPKHIRITPRRCAYRAFLPTGIRPARCPKRQAGPEKRGQERTPCPSFRAPQPPRSPCIRTTACGSASRLVNLHLDFPCWSFRIPQRSA